MNNLFLIAHKVRGEAAFDIACRMVCPECDSGGCPECDGEGFWWIIPTSGHRAYPYWNKPLLDHYVSLLPDGNWAWTESQESMVSGLMPDMPPDLPDHYRCSAAPRPKLDIRGLLARAKPATPINRRGL